MKVVLVVLFLGIAFAYDAVDYIFLNSDQDWFYDKHLECKWRLGFNETAASLGKVDDDEYKEYAQCVLDLAEAIDEDGQIDYMELVFHQPIALKDTWVEKFESECMNINDDGCPQMLYRMFRLE